MVLTMGGHHHSIPGVTAELRPAQALDPSAPAPFYLTADNRLNRTVKAGDVIRMQDLDLDPDTDLMTLRADQDAHFFG
jgi:predicted homoserine dehydrogenase-like protein